MKRLVFSGFIFCVSVFSVAGWPQEKKSNPPKKARVAQMMRDSTLVEQMMEQIAGNQKLRMKMMHQMMAASKSDTSNMMAMCRAMLGDAGMHQMMMKMMGAKMRSDQRMSEANEVLVKFTPDAQDEQIKAMALEIGMQQVKVIKELRWRVFRITSKKSVKEVLEACEKEPFVEYAEPNQRYRTQKR